MSNITLELPNRNTIIIADNDARGTRGRLDAADTVVINGQTYNPAGARNQAGASSWNYLLRVLQVTSLSGRNLQISADIFRSRERARQAAESMDCERSDEILRGSNTLASDNGMPMMSYHELGALGSIMPNDPTPVPDGGIAYLSLRSSVAILCADRPRGGAYITMERIETPLQISPETLRRFLRHQNHQPTPRRPVNH